MPDGAIRAREALSGRPGPERARRRWQCPPLSRGVAAARRPTARGTSVRHCQSAVARCASASAAVNVGAHTAAVFNGLIDVDGHVHDPQWRQWKTGPYFKLLGAEAPSSLGLRPGPDVYQRPCSASSSSSGSSNRPLSTRPSTSAARGICTHAASACTCIALRERVEGGECVIAGEKIHRR